MSDPVAFSAAQKTAARPKGIIARLHSFDAPFKALGQVGVITVLLSLAGWLIGTLIQYNAWRGEYKLKRYEAELAQATKTLAESAEIFSRALMLQQQLVFNYADADKAIDDKASFAFLFNQARVVHDEYRKARNQLRQSIGLVVRRAEIDLDWPSAAAADRDKLRSGVASDPLNVSDVEKDEIDCDKLVAPGRGVTQWRAAPVSDKPGAVSVDWRSAKHHLIVLYACFNQDHVGIEPMRRWSATSSEDDARAVLQPAAANKRRDEVVDLRKSFNLQVERFDKFIVLAMDNIESLRKRNEPPGYWCRLLALCDETPPR